jgi:hypothetical protein
VPGALGGQARIVVPVMAATGGAGRSTVAGLAASALACAGRTVVLDTSSRLASPWPRWTDHAGPGLAAIPPDQPLTAAAVRDAVSRCEGPAGAWEVLTDHRPWQCAPLNLPSVPEAWHQLSALGDWQAAVVDTTHPVADDVITARCAGHAGLTARWCHLPCAVPVFTTMATGSAVAALKTAVMAAEADGLPLRRTVLVVSAPADGSPPSTVKAALTMLERKLGAVVHVPYDARIRAHGLQRPSRLRPATLHAARDIADAVTHLACTTWGDPLPAAALPAPLHPQGTDLRACDAPRMTAEAAQVGGGADDLPCAVVPSRG